ncbi:MFS transporter [Dictyobacter arantiisoli]|uniref:MFS transporter n=1 Tax=Dictyobacter arantiisoli TaxID=2014874 RepID=A0A5A5TFZ7_9CHLR|nr:MFS transporter [Dictyobacter arantiisoli]GCF10287.1 MFS transporter [Dictyobacter arantiisoli]
MDESILPTSEEVGIGVEKEQGENALPLTVPSASKNTEEIPVLSSFQQTDQIDIIGNDHVTTSPLVDEDSVPGHPLRKVITVSGFGLASLVAGSNVAIKQLLLPLQISLLAPHTINTSFTLVATIGALAGFIAAPLTGAISDRVITRWGRRRPCIAPGIVVAVLGLCGMAIATTIPFLLVGEILAQIGIDIVLSAVTALIPDQVQIAQKQRNLISSLNGIGPNVGGVIALLLITTFTNTRIVAQGYFLLALVSLVIVALFLPVPREPLAQDLKEKGLEGQAQQRSPFRMREFFQPLQSREFSFVLLSRVLVYLAFTILGAYTLFYLRGVLHFSASEAAHGVTTFQLLSTACLIVTAFLAGRLAQSIGRLKPFVIGGAILMAVGLFLIVAIHSWPALIVAAILFGSGFGLYLGVDILLIFRVSRSEANRGMHVGIMYTAIFLPLIISPLIGGFVLNTFHNNFSLLFAVAASVSVLAALILFPLKTVK